MIQITFSIFIHLFLIMFCIFFVKRVFLSAFFEKSNDEKRSLRAIVSDNNKIIEKIRFYTEKEKENLYKTKIDLMHKIEKSFEAEVFFDNKLKEKLKNNNSFERGKVFLFSRRVSVLINTKIVEAGSEY